MVMFKISSSLTDTIKHNGRNADAILSDIRSAISHAIGMTDKEKTLLRGFHVGIKGKSAPLSDEEMLAKSGPAEVDKLYMLLSQLTFQLPDTQKTVQDFIRSRSRNVPVGPTVFRNRPRQETSISPEIEAVITRARREGRQEVLDEYFEELRQVEKDIEENNPALGSMESLLEKKSNILQIISVLLGRGKAAAMIAALLKLGVLQGSLRKKGSIDDDKKELGEQLREPYKRMMDFARNGQRDQNFWDDFNDYLDEAIARNLGKYYGTPVDSKGLLDDLFKFNDFLKWRKKNPGQFAQGDPEQYFYGFINKYKDLYGDTQPSPSEHTHDEKEGATCQECGEFYPYAPYKPNFTCKRCKQLRDAWGSHRSHLIHKLARKRGWARLINSIRGA